MIYKLLFQRDKSKIFLVAGSLGVILVLGFFNNNFILNRFQEIKNEINKPIVGNRYNSTNTRLAIYKCDYLLIKRVPFWGYGSKLQEQLNNCFAENNESEFYKIGVFNTHNYYFNLILYGGYLFLLLFLLYLIFLIKNLKHNYLAIFIFFQFLIINLTENYLSRHYGLVLFCYFTSLFIFFKKEKINART